MERNEKRVSEINTMREQHGPMKEQHGPGFDTLPGGEGVIMTLPCRFGNYDLERRIDVGGMGEVYLARQRSAFDREVAIKIIRPDLVHDMTARRRFLREAEVNAHIKHEHILALYEFGEEQGRLFLVTPYIAGGTLSRRLHKGRMPLSEVHQIFTALVKAVAYIHRRGVIHRDLKPSNILLDQEENNDRVYVRLIDFGIATIQGMAASPPLTTAGTEMGTLAYMAPERMSGIAAPSNDIFSLGIILYQMLTGHTPGDNPDADSINRSLPAPLAYVVNRSIAPRIDERFASADELLQAFERAYQSLIASQVKSSQIRERTGPHRSPDAAATNIETVTHRRTARVEGAIPDLITSAGERVPAESANYTNGSSTSEGKMASRIDTLSPIPQRPSRFEENDYGAPTVNFEVPGLDEQESFDLFSPLAQNQDALPIAPPIPFKPQKPSHTKKRRNPIFAIITLLIVIVLIVMASLFYFEIQPLIAPTATINLGPKVQPISTLFHITAQPSLKSSNLATASIPALLLNQDKVASRSGPTTGQNCPIPFLPINCQQTVQESDVNSLAVQLRQILQTQITTYLRQQLQIHNGTSIGTTQFTDLAVTPDPAIGTTSNTVTVSMTERGSMYYYIPTDAQNMARQLLQQQVQRSEPNYVLLNSSIEIGQPTVTGLNSSGIVLSIAAGGDMQYSLTPALLHDIANHVKGMKLEDAQVYLKQQPGIDSTSVSIHLSTGNTMPGNTQQITIIPVNSTTLPPFNLPTVTPVSTATTQPTATPGGNQ